MANLETHIRHLEANSRELQGKVDELTATIESFSSVAADTDGIGHRSLLIGLWFARRLTQLRGLLRRSSPRSI
jgi:hypothetical protein